ncbi:mandelate racemase/muconate lactonizing enzyme family protein [Kribbella turkmenica]|uniref:Mandelate racemase/muconate lactonizing enzyme family protein n=1 Tax=Kribbella turkmenica TaxID=2530375 RepID=A0A4R4X8R5_9ACTN|nr:mandelate racemase/muconate lactonizing enzyme family protein [Kribbella turkmenica]TDD26805.1 mandelate racemase/muconate lactonizing enzyme family protein [Kribbella turkmenica]
MPKITAVEAFPLVLAASDQASARSYTTKPPWPSIYGSHREALVVRVSADDGTVGWGEALAPVAPEVPAKIVELLLQPAMLGADPTRVRPLVGSLRALMRERGHLGGHQGDAIAAVDIALWDLAARIAGVGVTQMLGGAYRDTVPTYVSGLPGKSDAERVAQARDWVEQDVRRIKIGIGHGVRADLATVEALRDVHPDLQVGVDVHGVYDVADAVKLGRGLDRIGAWFLEAPVGFENIEGHAEVARRIDTPIAIGESLRHRLEFGPWLQAGAAGILQPDVGRTGITELVDLAAMADLWFTPLAPHHSAGLGIAMAASIQVSAAVQNLLAYEFHPTLFEPVNHILDTPIEPGPTGFAVRNGPGLGITVDEDAVRAACVA